MRTPRRSLGAALLLLSMMAPCAFVVLAEDNDQTTTALADDGATVEPHVEDVLDTLLKADIPPDELSMAGEQSDDVLADRGEDGGLDDKIDGVGSAGSDGTKTEDADVATADDISDSVPDSPIAEAANPIQAEDKTEGTGITQTVKDAATGAQAAVVDGAKATAGVAADAAAAAKNAALAGAEAAAGAAAAVLETGADGIDAAAQKLIESEKAIAAKRVREREEAAAESLIGESEDVLAGEETLVRDGEGVGSDFFAGRRNGRGIGHVGHKVGGSLKRAVRSYDRLLKEHYLMMSFVQATALGVVGDAIAQRLERRVFPGMRFDFTRTAHAGILNMIIDGILTPHWYNLVEHVNEERTLPVAFVKAIAASAIYSPFANGLFLAGARALRNGLKAHFDWASWRRQLMICTIRDFEMWPPLHILSFWLLPKHWRPLTSHVAGVFLLVVISSTTLEVGLPLGERAGPLLMRWAKTVRKAVGDQVRSKDKRLAGGPRAQ